MMTSLEIIFIAFSMIALISILLSRSAIRFGIPVLVIFLVIGMLAGSEGVGGIYFDDPLLAQWISTIALAIILFSGGVDTEWKSIKPVIKEGITLATLGVLVTAVLVGIVAHFLFQLTWLQSMLIGAIVSSTDAAAVFTVLKGKGINLKGRLAPLLELESGSNDPMAIFLTIGMIQLIQNQVSSPLQIILLFIVQIGVGGIVGWMVSKLALVLINRLKLGYEGLYPVLIFALVFLTFGLAAILKGSGFLAVYLLGLFLGKEDFLHKRSVLRFFDGNAWLMQITLFVTLGLLVFPSQLGPVALPGLIIAVFLICVARPIGVFLSLSFFKYSWREKSLISWVGLKGAVPIVLATFPLVEGLPHSDLFFNLTFFVVITSVLIQGTTLPIAAKWLRLLESHLPEHRFPLEVVSGQGIHGELLQIRIPPKSTAVGKAIYQLGLPADYLVILIERSGKYLQPNGSIIIESEDTLLSLSEKNAYDQANKILTGMPEDITPGS